MGKRARRGRVALGRRVGIGLGGRAALRVGWGRTERNGSMMTLYYYARSVAFSSGCRFFPVGFRLLAGWRCSPARSTSGRIWVQCSAVTDGFVAVSDVEPILYASPFYGEMCRFPD
jgi:hypothetical protein